MQANWPRFPFKLAAAALLAGLIVPAYAQVTCTLGGVAPSLARLEGNTELLSDIVFNCTGGLPTPAGALVPQVNIAVFLNTNATSRATSSTAAFGSFSEALLLIDEPNAGSPPGSVALTHPLLNCGNAGAPDTNAALGSRESATSSAREIRCRLTTAPRARVLLRLAFRSTAYRSMRTDADVRTRFKGD